MNALFDTGRILLFVLLLARASGFITAGPFWGDAVVPAKVKALFALALTVCLFGMAPATAVPQGIPDLVVLAVGELSIGVAFGFLARLFVFAFEMAGEIIAVQMGFGMAAVLDPLGGFRSTLIGRWMWLAGMTLFFTLGGHHLLLRAFGASLTALPPGTAFGSPEVVEHLSKSVGDAIAAPLRLAAPVIGTLLLATLGLGILARTVPQMNVFVVGFPVKIAVGILAIAFSLPFLAAAARGELTRLAHRLAVLLPVS
jgi:flagellar biosynthetic protein FliR